MAAVSLFILLALFHPAFSFPCRSFPCGELGEIFFPFTNNETDERCGPFVVDGCNEEIKKVQLGRGSQKWYQIESIFRDPFHYPHWSEISITDIELQSKLNSRKCSPRKALGIGFATVGMIISMFIIIFFWLRNKRKQTSSNIVPRNSSADIFSISDREGGNIFFGVSIFCYNALEKATNSFASENELGDGGFGAVYYGKLQDGREVAVKRLYERNYCKVQQFLNEIALLTRLRHKNLVSLYGTRHRHEINLAKLAINKIQRSALDELIDPCLGHQSDEEVKRMTTCVAELAFLCLQEDSELRPTMDEVLEELKRIESREMIQRIQRNSLIMPKN
ncbi:hypothetical protein GH714_041114 [Hevea brasiliensis]|uniref:Protein kinase domain-containing protein n=1 Tax=Hevea brasiliensis TaxID=3981 RepID=A0A6A6MW96_HEVBR|nr:hypothetical protein GH714_041114 [Hevea brasiliensis]